MEVVGSDIEPCERGAGREGGGKGGEEILLYEERVQCFHFVNLKGEERGEREGWRGVIDYLNLIPILLFTDTHPLTHIHTRLPTFPLSNTHTHMLENLSPSAFPSFSLSLSHTHLTGQGKEFTG